MLSTRLIHAVKLHPERNWKIAHRCGLHASTLSRWLNGAETPRRDDPRLRELAEYVGISLEECFAAEPTTSVAVGIAR